MGEARRRKAAGCIPEPKKEKTTPKRRAVGMIGSGARMAMLMALLSEDSSYTKQKYI